MGKYKGAVITTVGQNLIAEALAGHGTVTFTTLVTSSHQYPDSTNLQALTSLDDVEQTVIISSATVFDSNILQVAANVGNAGVTTAYLIHTIGLYAKLDDNAPVLAAVVVAINPDEMPAEDPASPSSFLYTIQMLISNADQISVTVNPAASVTVAELDLAMSYKYDKDNVAAVELTGVASRAYAVGEYILYNGKTYRVTVGIPSGTALTPGTNVLEVRLGEEINRKIDNTSVANNLVTTQSGYVLDARQGKVLKDAVDAKYEKSNVAYIQESPVATRAYAIGDYLLYNSRTYRVTAAIAAGGSIIPGSNATSVTIGDELKLKFDKANVVNNLTTTEEGFALDARQGKALVERFTEIETGTPTVVTSLGVDGVSCIKEGNLMYINMRTYHASHTTRYLNAGTTIFSLPEGFWPRAQQAFLAYAGAGTTNNFTTILIVLPNGEVKLTATGNYSQIWAISSIIL